MPVEVTRIVEAPAKELVPIPVVIAMSGGGAWPQTLIAKEKGFFELVGLEPEYVRFQYGRAAQDAALAGDAQFAEVAIGPVTSAAMQDQPTCVIAENSSYANWLVTARTSAGITEPADLAGKTVATAIGTEAHFFLYSFLTHYGMTFDDVNVIHVAPPDMVLALERGEVDAFVIWEPGPTVAKNQMDDVIWLEQPEGDNFHNNRLVTVSNKAYVEENPEAVRRYLEALHMADEYGQDEANLDEIITWIAADVYADDRELTQSNWDLYRYGVRLESTLVDEMEQRAQFSITTDAVPEGTKLPDFTDYICSGPLRGVVPSDVDLEDAKRASEEAAEVFTLGIVTVGPWDDNGWSQLHNEAGVKLSEYFGDRLEYIGVENVPFGEETTQTEELLISQGADMIIDGVSAAPFTDPVIEAHPEVKFISVVGSFLDPPPENYTFYNWHVGSYMYLLGAAAGMLTETNHIGYVAPFDFPIIRAQMVGYHMGARSVNPDVTTHVVTVNSWFDPAGARQATETLVSAGIDVIGGDMDEPTKVTVAEELGVWGIGAYSNAQKNYGPETYVNTYTYDFFEMWLPIIEPLIESGEWLGYGDLAFYELGEGIDIGEWGDNVPQDVIDYVDDLHDRMVSGDFNPFVGPIVDVNGVEVLADGETFAPLDWSLGLDFVLEGMEGIE